MTIMFAYGSNLNLRQMRHRCPDAEPLCSMELEDWRLVFRGVADCMPEPGAICHGGVWRITPECEAALDVYEGVAGGMYRKEWIAIDPWHGETEMLIYVMNSTGIMPPSVGYLRSIRDGYADFRMPKQAYAALAATVRASWDDKAPTHRERRRHARGGRPLLAGKPKLPDMPATGIEITRAS